MRTATLPSIRVTPELRSLAESVLLSGETLSTFMETSISERVQYRQSQKEFIARGLRNAQQVKEGSMRSYSLDEVVQSLRAAGASPVRN